jgi:hypothetical protein
MLPIPIVAIDRAPFIAAGSDVLDCGVVTLVVSRIGESVKNQALTP